MPYGLNKATNYYNKLEAWRDWGAIAEQARLLGLGEQVDNLRPADNFGWRKIDACIARLRSVIRDAELRNEAEQRYGEAPVSEQPTSDDVPRLQEWECLCGELYPVTFTKCPFCHAERPGIYQ